MTTSPADVDPDGCTHVIYSFLGLDKTSLTVTILDPDYEVIQGTKGKRNIDKLLGTASPLLYLLPAPCLTT